MAALHTDVIVVGGGPAGSTTAFFLARAGLHVTLLDRARFPRDKPCAEYLSPQASRLLHEMDVLEEVEQSGAAQLAGMRVVAPNGTAFCGDFAAQHGFRGFRDRGLALPRRVLDSILLARARALGAEVHEGVRVQDLVRERGVVCGVVGASGGGLREWRAPLVVGADGLRSVVSRRLGLARTGRWPRRYALVTHFSGVEEMGAYGEMHLFGDGYAGLADVGGGLTNVSVVVPGRHAAGFGRDTAAFLAHWLSRRPTLARRFRGATRLTPVRVTGPFNSRAPRAWHPGAALVGDAADFFDPFTGEGIYAAMRGAEVLSPYAFEAARDPGPRRQQIALEAYERARRAEFGGKWRVERLIGTAVGVPALMNRVAGTLARRREMADLLVGVAGDFVPARLVLRPRFLMRLLLPAWGEASLPPDPHITSHRA